MTRDAYFVGRMDAVERRARRLMRSVECGQCDPEAAHREISRLALTVARERWPNEFVQNNGQIGTVVNASVDEQPLHHRPALSTGVSEVSSRVLWRVEHGGVEPQGRDLSPVFFSRGSGPCRPQAGICYRKPSESPSVVQLVMVLAKQLQAWLARLFFILWSRVFPTPRSEGAELIRWLLLARQLRRMA